ncbi:DUF3265 domain-containing protein [Vibrio furnissii]|nr:DUF3265 domain-containing protein [Vibrio furnissii]
MKLKGRLYNKAFKRDSCRVAFLVCGNFCGERGLRKVGLYGIHPLTRRYKPKRKYGKFFNTCCSQ